MLPFCRDTQLSGLFLMSASQGYFSLTRLYFVMLYLGTHVTRAREHALSPSLSLLRLDHDTHEGVTVSLSLGSTDKRNAKRNPHESRG